MCIYWIILLYLYINKHNKNTKFVIYDYLRISIIFECAYSIFIIIINIKFKYIDYSHLIIFYIIVILFPSNYQINL